MSTPLSTQVHIDAILTNISVAYLQDPSHFIATQIFPIVPVDKQSDLYFIYTKDDWFRDEARRRGAGQESAGGGYDLQTDNYYCVDYAYHKDIADQIRNNSDSPLRPDQDAVEFVTQRLMLRQEVQWTSDAFGSGLWGTDITPASLWSDVASDPINDLELGKATILGNTGYMPNTLVLGYQVYQQLRNHPEIVDRIKYTSSDVVTTDVLARLFDIDRVVVATGVQNTGVEQATDAFSFIEGKNALLCYSAKSPGLMQPTAGYTFMWTGVSSGLGQNVGISKFRMEHLKSDRVEGEIAFVNKIVSKDLGYMFNAVVS